MDNKNDIAKEVAINQEKLQAIQAAITDIKSFGQFLLSSGSSSDTSEAIENILGGSVALFASDIHFEPEKEQVRFRLRVDGVLNDVCFFDEKNYKPILSRLKLLSGLKLNITDKSQDGRFTIVLEKNKIEARVSSLPSEYGESIVIRVLDPKSLITIDDLGIRPDMKEVFERQIRQPNGMIIATGPTGSGKTTTLYAILKKIQSPEIKIITIEDPIEYHLEGIEQSQVNPKKGYDFSSGLEAIVRQDPDVILVGEIRDSQTAKIALQAALTGHLLLTTLHTNDAAGTIVRLMALGEKPINIAPAIKLAIGQRLVRKICPKCKKLKTASSKELEVIKKEINGLPETLKEKVKLPAITSELKIPEITGCDNCNATGYKGRVGVFEFFLVDDELENFIAKSPNVAELRAKAQSRGMATMRQDGIIKVLQGITTLEEIIKTTED
ncbi:MAG: GspE/PulE family protein [Candidatus Pacebacteria bacterium]|nr:GspE/PulE family protein [Candidatus Paceibacterota bacterium]